MEEPLEFGRSEPDYSGLAPADLAVENKKVEKKADSVMAVNMRGLEFPQ